MSQYEMTVTYICGEDNTVADTLSQLPPNCFADEQNRPIAAILSVATYYSILDKIKATYLTDEFCKHVATTSMKGWSTSNGLWYINDRLLIPCVPDLCEQLFHLAHDCLGHFGADKSYAALRDAYYWPNMHCDLEELYIPSCADCLWNKSQTTKPASPLHPLLVPDQCGDSIAMDFIGPLPLDEGYDCILSIMDCLGSDV